MSWIFVSAISIFSTAILHFTLGITGTISPFPENNVGVGDTAMFTCRVLNRDRRTQNLLWQLSYTDPNSFIVKYEYFPAYLTNVDLPETPWIHGQYALSYSEGNAEEILNLYIYNITKDDGNFEVNCMYRIQHQTGIEDTKAIYGNPPVKLIVWTQPKCNSDFIEDIPPFVMSTDRIHTYLNCSAIPDVYALTLTWYKIEKGQRGLQILQPKLVSSFFYLDLTLYDYGSEYECVASNPHAKVHFELTCNVFPYFPRPQIIYDKLTVGSGEKFSLYCTYDADPKPKSNYFWYINTSLLNDIEKETAVNVTTTDIGSMLFLESTYLSVVNTNVTCETVIQDINTRINTSVTVIIEPSVEPTGHSPTNPKGMQLVTILVSTICGVFVIIIVVVIIICFYLRRKHPAAKTVDQIKMSSVAARAPDATKSYLDSHGIDSYSSVSHDKSHVYVVENNSKSIKDIRRTKTSSRKFSTKRGASHSNNSDTHGNANDAYTLDHHNEAHEDNNIPVKIKNASSEMIQRKQQANVEGLAYADLEISTPNQTVEDEIVRTDDVTVYTEVKVM